MKLTKILIYLLFVCLAFGQLEKFSFAPLYLHDLIIVCILLLNHKALNFPKPVWFFLAACFLSLILAVFKLSFPTVLYSSLYLVRFASYAGLYPVIKSIKLNLKPWLLSFGLTVAGFGLLQYLFLPDTRFLASLNWDDHYFRVISTLADPAFVGAILVLTLILIALKFKSRWYLGLPVLVALFLTYSRSSYLSLLAAILGYAILKKKFKFLLLALVFLALPFLPRPGGEGVKLERLFSVTQRLENYQAGLRIIKSAPLFGLGFNTLRFYRQDFVSHAAAGLDNSFLFVAATSGLVGLLAYLNLLRFLWKKSLLVKISLVALIVHSFFQNTLFYPFVMIWLWSVIDS
ncbi:MAG: O-antigen ligase family protein [Candidatus Beckwithbacteria bacterium]|nr:O-antigen ligase family protein [Candidatus Beckwithbacteria bacterium]